MNADVASLCTAPRGARILPFPARPFRAGTRGAAWLRQLRQFSREEDRATVVPDELVATVLRAWRGSA